MSHKPSSNPIEDILKSLPDAAKQIKAEADNVGRTLLNSQLQKADVVTREAFDEQRQLLQAALEKLQALETRIGALEAVSSDSANRVSSNVPNDTSDDTAADNTAADNTADNTPNNANEKS